MQKPLRVFIGFDPRQPVAYQVLSHSILIRSSVPVSITPLVLSTLPIKRRGLTEFTYSRYMVPWLCDYEGSALFLDADMLCLWDVADLFSMNDEFKTTDSSSVMVVKNKIRFEWPSLMLFNNSKCKKLTPEYIDDVSSKPQSFDWADKVGDIPPEWNHLVGYDVANQNAKIVHFTAGIPCFPETKDCEFSAEWNKEAYVSVSTVTWQELLGNSVHVEKVRGGFK